MLLYVLNLSHHLNKKKKNTRYFNYSSQHFQRWLQFKCKRRGEGLSETLTGREKTLQTESGICANEMQQSGIYDAG